ncbi:MAG: hypothetical protein PHU77_00380 [Simplicispira sp.]|nr:hypothetical protein [Simplicispira sp.]
MALHEQIEALARKHGATSYRNRADTQNPAYGFTPAGLLNLVAEVLGEVRKQDEALIEQLLAVLDDGTDHTDACVPTTGATGRATAEKPPALAAARRRLEGKP